VPSTLNLQVQQAARWPAKDSCGSMGLLVVPSRTRHRHCDEPTKDQSVVQTPCPCRPAVLWEGWHRVYEGDSVLWLGWALCAEGVIAPSRAHGSSRGVLCWSQARGTAIGVRMQMRMRVLWLIYHLRGPLCWGGLWVEARIDARSLRTERPRLRWKYMQAWPRVIFGCAMCLLCMGRCVHVWARVSGGGSRGCRGCRAEVVRFVGGCLS
jgi:hypothetical protein